MKCPKCGSALATVRLENIQLDKCHQCDGIWFDAGEVETIRKKALQDPEEILEMEYGSPSVHSGQTDGYMQCPRCESHQGRLIQHYFSYSTPVRVDRCQSCLGIWLDDGELNSLIEDRKQLQQSESVVQRLFQKLGRLFK